MQASTGVAKTQEAAESYLQQAIALIQRYHRNSGRADWPRIIARARSEISGATRPSDTYPAIRGILLALHEPHSFLVEPSAVPAPAVRPAGAPSPRAAQSIPMPRWRIVQARFGALLLPELNTMGSDGAALGEAYSSALRTGLSVMDRSPLCGWIVDLRQNGGGNMWPMLSALDPLLGEPPFGYFLLANGERQAWVRAGGKIFPTRDTLPETPAAFRLVHQSAPLAVLIGPRTASSGEMTALALIGRAGVRTFGAPSAGLTSANAVHPLPDGALLVLTESSVSDRNGRAQMGPIVPDAQVPEPQAETVAIAWLDSQCARDRATTIQKRRGRAR